MAKRKQKPENIEPVIENRKARHKYQILETLECGVKLHGAEVKSVRAGHISLGEGYVRATEDPLRLTLHGVHIGEYAPAGASQHAPHRTRILLAHKREIRKLAGKTRDRGVTITPLKLYWVRGRAKLLIGLAVGKRKGDKRETLAKRAHQRDIDRAMSR